MKILQVPVSAPDSGAEQKAVSSVSKVRRFGALALATAALGSAVLMTPPPALAAGPGWGTASDGIQCYSNPVTHVRQCVRYFRDTLGPWVSPKPVY